jgi:predicted ATP-grasp superfamily ATP-dependent carboligase
MYIESNEVTNQSQQTLAYNGAYDVLVLDAHVRQSLATVRSLGHRGLRVAALATNELPSVPAFSSRWCQQKIVSSAHEGSQEYLKQLEQILQSSASQVLIASSDGTISLLHQYREQIEQYTHLALPQESALEIALNKERSLELARECGLNVPKGLAIHHANEVDEALRLIGLPAVVKPRKSWDSQKRTHLETRLVTTREEARLAVKALTGGGESVLFQQFLPGVQESISFLYAHGEMYARFASWTKRATSPVGGIDVLRHSIALPRDSSTQAEHLVRTIGLEGYSRIDFRRDYTGKPYFVEISPSMSAGTELAIQAGVDFPSLLYQWASGQPIDNVQDYKINAWRRDLAADFKVMLTTIREHARPGMMPPGRAIRDFCASFFRPMKYDYLDWKDLRHAERTRREGFPGSPSRKNT